jgi:hypothetical protein
MSMYKLRVHFLREKAEREATAWRGATAPAHEAAACRRVAARLHAEEGRLVLRVVNDTLSAEQRAALSTQLSRVQRAARLAGRPDTLDDALELLNPELCDECHTLIGDAR